ncbi:hypothetical protein MKK88_15910 [Methylobacterium sp. E-005]|uniref:hypothetical protein n=1 Tax=Methylobacterium sp. E-005 TaxID=2836549 RepID=UPI001FBA3D90|nr:hypothetical protein [Methylobacterium sp. E-005]MCJ2087456.1 hypothetical protein [Methylobacterium sp. E-005]
MPIQPKETSAVGSGFKVNLERRRLFARICPALTEISMSIGRDYLLKKPGRPSAPKLFLDTQVVPVAVNVAGGLEVAVDRAARRLGVRPAVILAGAVGLASLSVLLARRSRADRWT